MTWHNARGISLYDALLVLNCSRIYSMCLCASVCDVRLQRACEGNKVYVIFLILFNCDWYIPTTFCKGGDDDSKLKYKRNLWLIS